jgi:hypothetical protein
MADFFPLISRAVSMLPDTATQSDRDAIYNKARAALERQLRSIEPALTEENIAKELGTLELSIAKVEGDYAAPKNEVLQELEDNAIFEELRTLSSEEKNEEPLLSPILIPDNDIIKTGMRPIERPRVKLDEPIQTGQKSKRKLNLVFAAGLPIIIGLMAVFGIVAINNKQPPNVPKSAPSPISLDAPLTDTPAVAVVVAQPGSDANATIPVAVRASLYEEDPTNPQLRIERRGAIVWRLETDTSDQAGQSIPRIRGNMEFPDAKLNAEIVLRRNLDASFPASHTIDVRFLATALDAKTVKGISLPEFRTDFQEKGPMLQAVKAPDIDNTFLIALLNTEPFQATNIELLKKSGWLFFEIRFADGKRGEIVFEKGVAGENAFREAFLAWKQ